MVYFLLSLFLLKNLVYHGKPNFSRGTRIVENKPQSTFNPKKTNFSKPSSPITSDFEKRKLAEQRATRRLKGENVQKENKSNKLAVKRLSLIHI